jgi:uncharacterized protein (UPF0179 family)
MAACSVPAEECSRGRVQQSCVKKGLDKGKRYYWNNIRGPLYTSN